MKEFKVGDRIAYYSFAVRYVGTIEELGDKGSRLIVRIESGSDAGAQSIVHPKQAYRLRKKKLVCVTRKRLSALWGNCVSGACISDDASALLYMCSAASWD